MRRVCGLDVHKDSVFMCILSENGEKVQEKYGILTKELDTLCEHKEKECVESEGRCGKENAHDHLEHSFKGRGIP